MNLKKTSLIALISAAMLAGLSNGAIAETVLVQGQTATPNVVEIQPMPRTHHWEIGSTERGHRMGQTGHQQPMAVISSLTPEQRAASKQAFETFHQKSADIRQQLLSKKYEYKAVLTYKPFNEQKLLAVSKEISALRNELYQQRVALDIQLTKAGVPTFAHHSGMHHQRKMPGHGMGMRQPRACP
ncbi:periplasmic heavy metal sensor [Serratia microhaemolytica]|uniref:periplasmic heavy metal sensor n=1 Tax=Serratia microhaemolytica TaxID=2675110 RepID=UPI000FDDCAB2|nr:periplasmic heavy metal sensor [Serratia microhaemolytica]